MKKVTIPTEMQGVDWSKPQWVISVDKQHVILTTGTHISGYFTGTCLPCNDRKNGLYSETWLKICFQPLTFDIPFTISNSNE